MSNWFKKSLLRQYFVWFYDQLYRHGFIELTWYPICLYIIIGEKSLLPSGIEIGGFYTASFVGRSDEKVIYKLTDHDISAASPVDLLDGTVEQCLDEIFILNCQF